MCWSGHTYCGSLLSSTFSGYQLCPFTAQWVTWWPELTFLDIHFGEKSLSRLIPANYKLVVAEFWNRRWILTFFMRIYLDFGRKSSINTKIFTIITSTVVFNWPNFLMFIDIGRTLEPVMALQSYMLYEANTQTHMYFRAIDPPQVSWQLKSISNFLA